MGGVTVRSVVPGLGLGGAVVMRLLDLALQLAERGQPLGRAMARLRVQGPACLCVARWHLPDTAVADRYAENLPEVAMKDVVMVKV